MTRPHIIVNVSGVLPRRGAPTETGTAFLVYAGATGPLVPTVCLSAADATTAAVPDAMAATVGDALEQGAPKVIVLRAAAVDSAAVTQPEWALALAKLTKDFGPGQVLTPGVSSAAAYAALLAHAAAFPTRDVFLDGASNAVAATLATTAAGLAAAAGAERAGVFAGWVPVPAPGDTTRNIPGSVAAAGLAARGDAAAGHANQAPIFDQGRSIGVVRRGTGVTMAYTDAEADTLYDAGVNTFRLVGGVPTLTGWRSVGDDPVFKQLNVGRLAMQLASGLEIVMLKFLGRQIDGKGRLFAEVGGAIRGYLLALYNLGALFGETADDAFDVDCSDQNNPPVDVEAGKLHAAAAVSASPHTEQITIDVLTAIAEGVAA